MKVFRKVLSGVLLTGTGVSVVGNVGASAGWFWGRSDEKEYERKCKEFDDSFKRCCKKCEGITYDQHTNGVENKGEPFGVRLLAGCHSINKSWLDAQRNGYKDKIDTYLQKLRDIEREIDMHLEFQKLWDNKNKQEAMAKLSPLVAEQRTRIEQLQTMNESVPIAVDKWSVISEKLANVVRSLQGVQTVQELTLLASTVDLCYKLYNDGLKEAEANKEELKKKLESFAGEIEEALGALSSRVQGFTDENPFKVSLMGEVQSIRRRLMSLDSLDDCTSINQSMDELRSKFSEAAAKQDEIDRNNRTLAERTEEFMTLMDTDEQVRQLRMQNNKKTIEDYLVLNPKLTSRIDSLMGRSLAIAKTGKLTLGKPLTGLLFYGKSGTGKTALAKLIAAKYGMPCEVIKGGELGSRDQALEKIAKIRNEVYMHFKRTKQMTVVVFDDVDGILDQGSAMSKAWTAWQDASMHDIRSTGCVIVTTINEIDKIAKEMLRRNQIVADFDKPDVDTRRAILQRYLNLLNVSKDVDLGVLVELTEGKSGAELQIVVNDAIDTASAREGLSDDDRLKAEISMSDFEEACAQRA